MFHDATERVRSGGGLTDSADAAVTPTSSMRLGRIAIAIAKPPARTIAGTVARESCE